MKINGILISSYEALRRNFDIHELWNRRRQAVRALSYDVIPYPADPKLRRLFDIFAAPENAVIENGMLRSGDFGMPVSPGDLAALDGMKAPDLIRALALYMLVGRKAERFMCPLSVAPDCGKVTLGPGTWNLSEIPSGEECTLRHLEMRAPANLWQPVRVGRYWMHPGDATYGVFCNGRLVAVAPPKAMNGRYFFEYADSGNGLRLQVTEISSRKMIEYEDAHFYCIVDDTDYVIIDGLSFLTSSGEIHNRLRDVPAILHPEIVKCDGSSLVVTHRNGRMQTIKIK